MPHAGGDPPDERSRERDDPTIAPRRWGSTLTYYQIARSRKDCPTPVGVTHTEGQVFQYTIDLNKKRTGRRQLDREEKKAPVKTIAKEQLRKPLPRKTPEEIADAEEKRQVARRVYEQARNRNTERREYNRLYAQEKRQKAKELGKCRDCSKPTIPGQTRCPTCVDKHRQSHQRAKAKRRAKQTVAPGQQAMLMT